MSDVHIATGTISCRCCRNLAEGLRRADRMGAARKTSRKPRVKAAECRVAE
jgi:hypothetical protein